MGIELRKAIKNRRRPHLRCVKHDRIDQIARFFCLAMGSTLFVLGVVLLTGLIGNGNQVIGLFIVIASIPFVVLARRFKKVKIKGMVLEIEAE